MSTRQRQTTSDIVFISTHQIFDWQTECINCTELICINEAPLRWELSDTDVELNWDFVRKLRGPTRLDRHQIYIVTLDNCFRGMPLLPLFQKLNSSNKLGICSYFETASCVHFPHMIEHTGSGTETKHLEDHYTANQIWLWSSQTLIQPDNINYKGNNSFLLNDF